DHNDDLLHRLSTHVSGVDVVASTRSPGLAGARNTGVAVATGAVVAFIDDDAEADPDWLKFLGAAYADDGVLGVGGAVEPAWQHGRPTWFAVEFDWVVGCTYQGVHEVAVPVGNIIGAGMAFGRVAYDACGDFPE